MRSQESEVQGDARSDLFEVAICGGGLAGQALARQLKLRFPDIAVAVVDRLSRPLPEAAFKVGESSVETGAHYLSGVLQLQEYFKQRQLPKLGLRYFFGDTTGDFERRPELGLTQFPHVSSYQIDRGVLENDLRAMNATAGVTLIEGVDVEDVILGEGDAPHAIVSKPLANGARQTIRARWLVDASGRRRFIQRKLGLHRNFGKPCSAVWWRLEGRIDVSDLVSDEHTGWQQRVPDRNRYYSTTHLMGNGYWFWLIPLSSGNTSVGIVALEDIHPFSTFNTYERALDWLRTFEPAAARYVEHRKPMDFLCRRKYTYSSRRVFSPDRWTCVGEAGVFADPYYSPGNDMIGFSNSITTQLIALDRDGKLTPRAVDDFNLFFLSLNNWVTQNIHAGYPFFGHAVVMVAKAMWDFLSAWGFVAPQMFNGTFLEPAKRDQVRAVTSGMFSLTLRMQRLFGQWAERSQRRYSYDFVDYLSIGFLRQLRARNLRTGKTMEELVEDGRQNMRIAEEMAQVLFLIALSDTMPERIAQLPQPLWINPWAVSLEPEKWGEEGLFRPESAPRDLGAMRTAIEGLFRLERTPMYEPKSTPPPLQAVETRAAAVGAEE